MTKGIYILGGMGPQASAELYRLLIAKAQSDFRAVNNDDFPEVTIHSIPVPDFIGDETKKPAAQKMLEDRVAAIPAEFYGEFAIACNTVHLLAAELKAKTPVSFVSMIDAVAKRVANKQAKKVGLLGTPTTLRSGLYQNSLKQYDIEVLTPDAQDFKVVEAAIRAVLAGELLDTHRAKLDNIISDLRKAGADIIVLGCTELPLIYADKQDDSIVSSLDALSDALLKSYYN